MDGEVKEFNEKVKNERGEASIGKEPVWADVPKEKTEDKGDELRRWGIAFEEYKKHLKWHSVEKSERVKRMVGSGCLWQTKVCPLLTKFGCCKAGNRDLRERCMLGEYIR